MPDKMTKEQRHRCMSSIHSRDTKPELIVRRWLWAEGYRYRVNVRGIPGTPDIVLRRLHTAIFVNGCFWHGHGVEQKEDDLVDSPCCRIPTTNRDFWLHKIERNCNRDRRVYATLRQNGWRVLVVWACWLLPRQREATLKALSLRLAQITLELYGRKKPITYSPEEYDYMSIAAEPEPIYQSKNNKDYGDKQGE